MYLEWSMSGKSPKKSNKQQLSKGGQGFEDFLASLSARLVALLPDQVDDEIQKALEKCLHFFGIDRLALLRLLP